MSEIPEFLSHLKVYGEYPVPFVQMWIDGKPDFRVIDPARSRQCVEEKLCAICGRRLGEYCYLIGGPKSKETHMFTDAPMHEPCVTFVSRTCPFVSGKKDYSRRPVAEQITSVAVFVEPSRPQTQFIFKTRTKNVRMVDFEGAAIIQAGVWFKVSEI
jgi:hypothetical protein